MLYVTVLKSASKGSHCEGHAIVRRVSPWIYVLSYAVLELFSLHTV